MKKKLTLKNTAVSAGVLSAAMVPQYCEADLVTVGGDGGVGRVTLELFFGEDAGGLLASPITFTGTTAPKYIRIGGPFGTNSVGDFARSSVSTVGVLDNGGNRVKFSSSYDVGSNGAILGSDDNWMPGHFNVNGVNGGNAIFGWAHIGFGTRIDAPELISFTYDDDAIDTTAFVKPVGGFSVSTVPEPSSFAGLALLACGAAGVRRRRQLAA